MAVRLSEVPDSLRQEFMHKMRSQDERAGMDAFMEWGIAALAIRQDPVLIVPEWKADLVLREGKAPPGETPHFGKRQDDGKYRG